MEQNKQSFSILLVDDDPLILDVMTDYLVGAGHRVKQARGGAAAYRVLGGSDLFDIALIDYAMPGQLGREVAQHIRELRPELKIAFLTAHIDFLDISGRAGGFPVIAKGADLARVVAAIEALASGQPFETTEERRAMRESRKQSEAVRSSIGLLLHARFDGVATQTLPNRLKRLLRQLGR